MTVDGDDSEANQPPSRPEGRRQRSWAGTVMHGCAPTEQVQERLKQARDHKQRLGILVEAYSIVSLRYAQRLRCVHFTPADVVQQAFVKIASRQALDRYSVSRAWMITCLRNAWCDLCRKHRLHPALDPELEAAAVDDFNAADLLQTVRAIIASLADTVGEDPAKRALFDDWRKRKLDLDSDDTELRQQFGALLPSKRHQFAEKYDVRLARRLCAEFGVDRLEEIKESLNRRGSRSLSPQYEGQPEPPEAPRPTATGKGAKKTKETSAGSLPPADGEQESGATPTWPDSHTTEDA